MDLKVIKREDFHDGITRARLEFNPVHDTIIVMDCLLNTHTGDVEVQRMSRKDSCGVWCYHLQEFFKRYEMEEIAELIKKAIPV